jgi:hypothetical protein
MKFQVPQFIGIEDKVFGPFTVKQFVYLAGGAGVCYLLYHFLPFLFAVILIVPVAALALSLAFIKINNKPFVFTLEAAVKYFIGNKLYLWRKTNPEGKSTSHGAGNQAGAPQSTDFVPRLGESKLREITWALDVNKEIKR